MWPHGALCPCAPTPPGRSRSARRHRICGRAPTGGAWSASLTQTCPPGCPGTRSGAGCGRTPSRPRSWPPLQRHNRRTRGRITNARTANRGTETGTRNTITRHIEGTQAQQKEKRLMPGAPYIVLEWLHTASPHPRTGTGSSPRLATTRTRWTSPETSARCRRRPACRSCATPKDSKYITNQATPKGGGRTSSGQGPRTGRLMPSRNTRGGAARGGGATGGPGSAGNPCKQVHPCHSGGAA